MGTKENPGKFDCYDKALPDEPVFILLGRDPDFYRLVKEWAERRGQQIRCGDRPESDIELVKEAEICARMGAKWRKEHFGKWRK